MSTFGKVLLWTWFIITSILLAFSMMMSQGSDAILPKYSVIVMMGIWLFPFVALMVFVGIQDKISTKKREKEALIYRSKYISPFEMSTEHFGLLKFDYDTNQETLEFKEGNLPMIGTCRVEELIVENYQDNTELVVAGIESVYAHADEIVKECAEMIKGCYDDAEVTDESGQPLSLEFYQKDLQMSEVRIILTEGYADVEVRGYLNTEFENGFTEGECLVAYIEGSTGKLSCDIE